MIMELYDSLFNLAGHLCHQKPERSFFFRGFQFPFCARCTGIILGFIVGLVMVHLIGVFKSYWIFALFIPLIIDGLIQKYSSYESNNLKRVSTGFIFGFAYFNVCYMFLI